MFLEAVYGYLTLAIKLSKNSKIMEAFNFGPNNKDNQKVSKCRKGNEKVLESCIMDNKKTKKLNTRSNY